MVMQELFKFVFNDIDMRDIIFKYKFKFNKITLMGKIHDAIIDLGKAHTFKKYNQLIRSDDIVYRKKSIKGYTWKKGENYGKIYNKKDFYKLFTKFVENYQFVKFYDPEQALKDVEICLKIFCDHSSWSAHVYNNYYIVPNYQFLKPSAREQNISDIDLYFMSIANDIRACLNSDAFTKHIYHTIRAITTKYNIIG